MSSDDRSEVKKVAGRGVKTTITLVVALALSGVLLEGGARFTWSVLYNQWLEGQLHGYGHADRELTDGLAR
jgi:hypothetical protein